MITISTSHSSYLCCKWGGSLEKDTLKKKKKKEWIWKQHLEQGQLSPGCSQPKALFLMQQFIHQVQADKVLIQEFKNKQ